MARVKYYSLTNILKYDADYNVIVGERSNGKTYSVKELAIKNHATDGSQLGLIRRYDLDFKGKRGTEMFADVVQDGLVTKYTKGEWTDIYYFSSRWYFCKYDNKGDRIVSPDVFAYAFYLGGAEHDKSTSYPKITTILFDEFITRDIYLPEEFILFTNILSTIIRLRDNVKIFMLGNTVNKYCIYFKEMGLTNILKMDKGAIDIYTYGDSKLRVAVEYCETLIKNKPSNKYFAFNNPKLEMIKSGAWEIAIYPHLPTKYTPNDILFTYFIEFENELLQCEIVQQVEQIFTYIHRKTTPIKNKTDIVFSQSYDGNYYQRRRITLPKDDLGRKIYWFFANEKVFYQDNEVGEIVRNYLNWSKTDRGIL